MKNFLSYLQKAALFVSFLFSQMIFSQNSSVRDYISVNKDNRGIKKITVKRNDTIREEHYFNKNGKPYLILNNPYSVAYYKYDNKNRIIKKIEGHTVIGFSDEEVKYSKNKTEVFSYLTDDEKMIQIENDQYLDNKAKGVKYTIVGKDTISIDDAYAVVQPDEEYSKYKAEIERIKDTAGLFNSPNFKRLLTEPKYLSFLAKYDSKSRPINEKYFNSRNKVTSDRNFYYLPKEITVKYNVDMIGIGEIIQTLDDHNNVVSEVEKDKILKYKYEKGNCIEEKEFKGEKLLNIRSHTYDNQLLIKDVFEDLESASTFFTDYVYDNNKRLIQKTDTSKHAKYIYKYEYEYFK